MILMCSRRQLNSRFSLGGDNVHDLLQRVVRYYTELRDNVLSLVILNNPRTSELVQSFFSVMLIELNYIALKL